MERMQKGFTLIELLIVVAILGILAAIAIPNLTRFIGSADLSAANTEASTVHLAATAYYADNNAVAPSTDVLTSGGYMTGALVGTYTISANDTIVGVKYGDKGFIWNPTKAQWTR